MSDIKPHGDDIKKDKLPKWAVRANDTHFVNVPLKGKFEGKTATKPFIAYDADLIVMTGILFSLVY